MDVLIVYCDSGAPSRPLRFLEAGVYHQVLADSQFDVTSLLVRPGIPAERVVDVFRRDPARLVAVMMDEFNGPRSLELAGALRAAAPDLPICAFGIFPALAPERVFENPAISSMIVGEGEIALYELATTLLRTGDMRGIKNLWYRTGGRVERNPLRPLQDNLDQLPYPDRSLFAQDTAAVPFSESTLWVAASRGCPYECQFCYSPLLKKIYAGKGTYYRMRTAQHLVGEILAELRKRPYSRIVYADEMFPADRLWLRDFARKIAPITPPSGEVTLAADKCDSDIMDQLQAAGIGRIVLGVETGNDAFRGRIAARNCGNDRIESVIALARERGITVATANLTGLPLESVPLAEETYTFNKSLAPDEIRSTVYQPIEGTPLAELAQKNGLLNPAPAAEPDFTALSLRIPDLPAEAVRQHLTRMHFLNLFQKLRSLPQPDNGTGLLHEIPRAKFRLPWSGALELGVTERDGHPLGYLAIGAGAECRFPMTLASRALLRFALSVPEVALRALGRAGYLVAEMAWEPDGGEAQVLFSRMIAATEASLARHWRDCLAFGPETGGAGQVLLRVSAAPIQSPGICVFWGDPTISADGAAAPGAAGGAGQQHLEDKLDAASAEAAALRAELERLREAERLVREERDAKNQRLGELQIRLIELEKQVTDQALLLNEVQTGAEGMTSRLKGIFRK